jgi:hypothetical protein
VTNTVTTSGTAGTVMTSTFTGVTVSSPAAGDWIYTDIHVRKVKDIETGGRPSSLNEPIRLESMKNNVGFSIGYKNLLHETKPETDVPF